MVTKSRSIAKKPFPFAIIGIGASAGGMASFEALLRELPDTLSGAIVFIQRLLPDRPDLLHDLLAKKFPTHTFVTIKNGSALRAGKIYLAPPGVEVALGLGGFRLKQLPKKGLRLPIDAFFSSLAKFAGERSIAVVLSGAGTDGVRGVSAIRGAGGAVLVQDPSTAEFSSMPAACITAGGIDAALAPAELGKKLSQTLNTKIRPRSGSVAEARPDLTGLFGRLRQKAAFRFDEYKENVVVRRVQRRMGLYGITTIEDYLDFMDKNPMETAQLANDMLIGVTGFFRDIGAWKDLKEEVIKPIIRGKRAAETIRVWTPACSSGEEPYSIAMMLTREIKASGKRIDFQVFATDINDAALIKAREGTFAGSFSADIPPYYLRANFNCLEGDKLQANKELRDHIVFARQNILTDPSFSKLDLIICRNLLIYLEQPAQEKCIALFHYALLPEGYLFLGNAESVGHRRGIFKSIGKKNSRIYKRLSDAKPSSSRFNPPLLAGPLKSGAPEAGRLQPTEYVSNFTQEQQLAAARDELQTSVEEYRNANEELHSANEKLQAANEEMEASREELQSLNEELLTVNNQLQSKIEEQESTNNDLHNFFSSTDIPTLFLDSKMQVKRFTPALHRLTKLVEADIGRPIADLSPENLGSNLLSEARRVLETLAPIKGEMAINKVWFIRTLLPYRTSDNRIQGVVVTFVDITELKRVEEEIGNIAKFPAENPNPIMRVIADGTIAYGNPAIKPLMDLWQCAVGAALTGPLRQATRDVLSSRVQKTLEIETGGRFYFFAVVPIAGAPYVNCYGRDITIRKQAEEALEQSEEKYRTIVETAYEGIWEIDARGRTSYCNGRMAQMLGYTIDEMLGKKFSDFMDDDGRRRAEATFEKRKQGIVGSFEQNFIRKDGAIVWLISNGTPVHDKAGKFAGSLGMFTDITERKRAEEAVRESQAKLKAAFASMTEALFIADAEGRLIDFNDEFVRYHRFRDRDECSRTIADCPKYLDVWFPDGTPAPPEQWAMPRALRGETASNVEYRLRRKETGETWWGSYSFSPIKDQDGGIVGAIVAGREITGLKRTEEALREAHQRTATVLNNIADTFYSLDGEWRFTEINPAAEKAPFNRPASELLGKVIWDLYPKLVGTPIQRHYLDAAEKKSLEHYEAPSPLNHRWYEVFMQGRAGGVDVYMRDITGRKESEEALSESEAQLSAVFNGISETLMLLDVNGVILAANDLAARRLNRGEGDFVGKNLFDLIPVDFHQIRKEQIAELVRTKKPVKFEDRLADRYLDLTFYPIFDENGDVIRFVSFALDVTELKAREWDLDKLNRTLRALGKSSQAMLRARNEQEFMKSVCGVILEDCGYKMVWIGMAENDPEKSVRPVESCGFEEGYLETLKITWADTERGQGPTGTAIRTGKVGICKNMLTDPVFEPWRKEALARGYASSIALPLIEDGTAFGALTIYSEKPDAFIDEEVRMLTELADDLAHGITVLWLRQAREKMEDQLAARATELTAANKELESFAYSVSHDLRAPLRAMHGFSGILLKDYGDKLDEDGRDYLSRIAAGAQKMNALIDDIMSLSQISRQEMGPGDVNLSEIVAGILHDLRQAQPRRMVETIIAPGVRAIADARLIRIALTNLVQNAWKYTGKRERARIEFGTEKGREGTAYFVRDNGAGFDMRHASRLFAAFARLHAEKDFPGTGIGLAIVNRVIARHGGKVWAEAKPNEGACFWFTLPLRAQQPIAATSGGET